MEAQRAHVRQTLAGELAFYPPPTPRSIALTDDLVSALSRADHAVGELSGVGRRLPNPHLLINAYLRREAVLSLRIEGTQSSLSELLLFEAGVPSTPRDELREVVNYVGALQWGVARLPKLPLGLRLVRELHAHLLEGVRGDDKTPGDFRKRQNWIGPSGTPIRDAVFVPPPPEALPELLDDWEKFVHEEDRLPSLLRCGLLHYQFETIHPFVDGNGRLGRLLMSLFLIERGVLSAPLLYLSAYLEANRTEYYEVLMSGRLSGDLTPWLLHFLTGVETQARDAAQRADRLVALQADYRRRLGRSRSAVAHAIVDDLLSTVYITIPLVAKRTGVTYPAAKAAVDDLVSVGILRDAGIDDRPRAFYAREVLDVIAPEESAPAQGAAEVSRA